MIFEFGPYRVDVDVERTRQWYKTEPTANQCCDCDGCINFERAADLFPERVKSFFTALGADAKKPIEVFVNHTNKDGTLFYGGWYHLASDGGGTLWPARLSNLFQRRPGLCPGKLSPACRADGDKCRHPLGAGKGKHLRERTGLKARGRKQTAFVLLFTSFSSWRRSPSPAWPGRGNPPPWSWRIPAARPFAVRSDW